MESSSKSERNHHDFREEARNQEAAIHDKAGDQQDTVNYQDENNAINEGGLETATLYTTKDAKDSDQEDNDLEHQETDNIQDSKRVYPPGLTKDKKRAIRKRAQTISIERKEKCILREITRLVCQRST